MEFLTATVYRQGGYNIIVQNGWSNRLVPRAEKNSTWLIRLLRMAALNYFKG